MGSSLPIGDFSRATHLSIKTLRHYHSIGLLEPADVDPGTGHRRYTTGQIATAQVIRRFRSLDMPLEEVQAVLRAPDVATRNALISGHLSRLEATLARTQEAAASLRELLQPPAGCTPVVIEHRQVAATPAVAVRDTLHLEDASSWFQGALGELYGVATAQKLTLSGQAGGIFASDLFTHGRGEATIYVPCPVQSGPPGESPRSPHPPSNWPSSPTPDPTRTWTAPTDRWEPTSQNTPSAWTAPCASSMSSAAMRPPTRRCGGPRSDGRSSRRREGMRRNSNT
jgi:DNA-binding transcriptional MerR regulator